MKGTDNGRRARIEHILFDLDLTLYSPTAGLMQEISRRISLYMTQELGFSRTEVDRQRREYWRRYGTSLRGLMLVHRVDPEAFLLFVHDIPVHEYVTPSPELDLMLQRLPQHKHLFTNSEGVYAGRVLEALGVRDHFQNLFDIRFLDYVNKPDEGAYRRVLDELKAPPERCLIIDDGVRNLLPAGRLGMTTVLVKGRREVAGDPSDLFLDEPGEEAPDFTIDQIVELPEVLEELGLPMRDPEA